MTVRVQPFPGRKAWFSFNTARVMELLFYYKSFVKFQSGHFLKGDFGSFRCALAGGQLLIYNLRPALGVRKPVPGIRTIVRRPFSWV